MRSREREYTRVMPCRLTSQELVQVTQQAAHLLRTLKKREADLKAHIETEKEAIRSLTEDWNGFLIKIREESEQRLTRMKAFIDLETDQYIEVRLDTGEEVERRPLRDEERQFSLDEEMAHAEP